jgi:hypothetical protein
MDARVRFGSRRGEIAGPHGYRRFRVKCLLSQPKRPLCGPSRCLLAAAGDKSNGQLSPVKFGYTDKIDGSPEFDPARC